MERESFKSRLGFLLVSAGCAIGIGNVWRFPFVTGQNGGGLFVLLYLLFLIIMGMPVLTMELAVGRASKKSAILGYKELEKKGSKWHVHGWFCLAGNYLLMMYYTTVAGWMLSYFIKFLKGDFKQGMTEEEVGAVFGNLLGNPVEMSIATVLVVVCGILVISFGVQKGLERVSKFMMVALIVLMFILAIHSFTLPNAMEGIKFYLVPSLSRAKEIGLRNVITAAMNQAFFTLSLGIGAMEIFGSYMSDNETLPSESLRICGLDTFVAIMSGLIIFPACFAFGVQPDAGPGLIFNTLPNVFTNMVGGRIWGTLFFLFMVFASFSTVIAVFENIIATWGDTFKIKRVKAALINLVIIIIASLPCVFGYNIWSNLRIIGDRDVLDSEDFLVSNLLLPIGSLVYLLFCVTKLGWGYDNYTEEANKGKGFKFPNFFKYYFWIVLPILIIVIIVQGLI